MKKFLFTILVAVLISPVFMNAEIRNEAQPNDIQKEIERISNYQDIQVPMSAKFNPLLQNQTLDQTYNVIGRIEQADWNVLGFVTPYVYEPASGFYFNVFNTRQEDNDNEEGVARLYLRWSTNGGNTWQARILAEELSEDAFLLYPSINVYNSTGGNTLADIDILVTCPRYTPTLDGTSYTATSTKIISVVSLDDFTGPETVDFSINQPTLTDGPNSDQYGFIATQNFTQGNNFYMFGRALLRDSEVGGSTYAVGRIPTDLTDLKFYRPANLTDDNFRPGDQPGSSYNGAMLVDADEEGNLYGAFNNFYGNTAPGARWPRVPGFSKSTDGGETWSEINQMPTTVLDDFLFTYGWDGEIGVDAVPFPSQFPYQGNGFIVTGPDQLSIFVNIYIYGGDAESSRAAVAEAHYDGSAWSMNLVSMLEARPDQFLVIRNAGEVSVAGWRDSLQVYNRGNELQAARTENNDAVIVKFNDLVEDYVYDIAPYNVDGTGTGEVIIYSSDTYMAVKDIANNTWLEAKNVTEDIKNDKGTYVPRVVPSIERISFFNLDVVPWGDVYNTDFPRSDSPERLQEFYADWNPQDVQFTEVNYNNPVSVENEETLSVTDIFPNPSAEQFTLNFNVENPGQTTIKMYDSMGRLVSNLVNEFMDGGFQSRTFRVNELGNGTYYINMVNGATNETIPLQIVR